MCVFPIGSDICNDKHRLLPLYFCGGTGHICQTGDSHRQSDLLPPGQRFLTAKRTGYVAVRVACRLRHHFHERCWTRCSIAMHCGRKTLSRSSQILRMPFDRDSIPRYSGLDVVTRVYLRVSYATRALVNYLCCVTWRTNSTRTTTVL